MSDSAESWAICASDLGTRVVTQIAFIADVQRPWLRRRNQPYIHLYRSAGECRAPGTILPFQGDGSNGSSCKDPTSSGCLTSIAESAGANVTKRDPCRRQKYGRPAKPDATDRNPTPACRSQADAPFPG